MQRRWEQFTVAGRTLATAPRPGITRRQALERGAFAAGAVAGLGVWNAVPALAGGGSQPRPIPGGFDESFNLVPKDPFIHVLPPAFGIEPSTITDFHGVIAAGEVQGAAHGSDGSEWWFDCDMRFMEGKYVAVDGRLRDAAFGFV